jgi:hypothetical protein
MTKTKAPLKRVVRSVVGPGCYAIPGGMVCGPPTRQDTLECGHVVTGFGRKGSRSRRCPQCLAVEEGRLF